jgi:hypothetical protein
MAYDQSANDADRIAAATLIVKLHLVEYHLQGVFEQADRIFRLLGSDIGLLDYIANPVSDWQPQSPQTADSLTQAIDAGAEVDENHPIHATAFALCEFMIAVGPSLYTRLPAHAEYFFDLATSVILRSRKAISHPAAGYIVGVRAILCAYRSKFDLAGLYVELGHGIPWRDTPWAGSCEIPFKAIDYIRINSIAGIDYASTWNAAALSNATDILIYISAIELGAIVLSGRSIPLVHERGIASLVQLKNDLSPAVRPFLTCFVQLALNLQDAHSNPLDLYHLDGEAMSWTEAEGMDNHGDLIGVSFWSTALLNAVLFRGPAPFVRDLAKKTRRYSDGWRGLLGHFKYLLIFSWYILEYDASDAEDDAILAEAHAAFAAFPQS